MARMGEKNCNPTKQTKNYVGSGLERPWWGVGRRPIGRVADQLEGLGLTGQLDWGPREIRDSHSNPDR